MELKANYKPTQPNSITMTLSLDEFRTLTRILGNTPSPTLKEAANQKLSGEDKATAGVETYSMFDEMDELLRKIKSGEQ